MMSHVHVHGSRHTHTLNQPNSKVSLYTCSERHSNMCIEDEVEIAWSYTHAWDYMYMYMYAHNDYMDMVGYTHTHAPIPGQSKVMYT